MNVKKFKSIFDISDAKLKRISSRICRVRARVAVYHKLKGFASRVNLDSTRCDNIGMTRESLDEYMKIIMPNTKDYWYHVEKWSINPT